LIADGLHFAHNDQITLEFDANAHGTHLGTSLKDLQHLGVDTVLSTGHDINVDLGLGGALSADHLPTFDRSLDVTLNLAPAQHLSDIEALADVLKQAGIDHVAVAQSDLLAAGDEVAIHALMSAGIDFNVSVTAGTAKSPVHLEQVAQHFVNEGVDLLAGMLDPNTNMAELLKTLSQSGIHSIEIERPASVVVGDHLAAALSEAGMLQAMPDARVEIDAGVSTLLQTSLKAMADLGVDRVASTAAVGSHIAMALGTDIKDIADVLQSFISETDHVSTKSIFDHAVDLYVGSAVEHETLQTLLESGVGAKLAALGISKVVVQDLPPVQPMVPAPDHSDPFAIDLTDPKLHH
jgi:hypothetical protein